MLEKIYQIYFLKTTLTAEAKYESCLKKPCNNFTALQNKTMTLGHTCYHSMYWTLLY